MSELALQPPRPSGSNPMMSNGSRPSTQSGYRFGQLSRSSFFARHNPHPHRCIHIKGLLGLPIPVVVDDCDHSSYETHLCFPPNGHNDQKLLTQRLLLPVNAIHLNSNKHPLDTINGLQYFTSLRNFSFKEKAVPRLGLVPVTESWREQLRSLTEQTFSPDLGQMRREATVPDARSVPVDPPQKPASAPRPMYSQQTGRLIPPPSRAMSRRPLRSSHRATPAQVLAGYEHISAGPDLESAVFSMLCQILQTEDFNAVQAWLVSASDREKALVMDVIRSAVANKAAYYEAEPTGVAFEQPAAGINIREDLRLPPIAEAPADPSLPFDRLVIEEAEPLEQQAPQQQALQQAPQQDKKFPDAKPAAGSKTRQSPQQPPKPKAAKNGPGKQKKNSTSPKLKYSKNEPVLSQSAGKDIWRPQESYAA